MRLSSPLLEHIGPAFHHPLHVVHRHIDIRQRIILHRHQVREISGATAPNSLSFPNSAAAFTSSSVAAKSGQPGHPESSRRCYDSGMRLTALSLLVLSICFPAAAQNLPTVAVVSTGGTIASKHDPSKGGYVAALSGEDLVAAVPEIKKIAQIQVEQFSNIPSDDMTPEIWIRLAGKVNDLLAKPEIAGVVVTHGTDTLEETAYFLDLTTISSKPVILVGAQRPASDPDADGPRNLFSAVRVAIAPEAAGKGVMVVMNGQINAARDVTKTNTNRVETFRGLEFGLLGVADAEKVRFYRAPLRRQTFAVDTRTQLGRVDIVMSYAGADGLAIRSLLRDGTVQGFVIAGLGLGNVPGSMFDAIQEVRAQGIPVVISTRVPTGRIFSLSAIKGSSLSLRRIGCVLADDLSPQKARILLMLALTKTRDAEALQKFFDN